MREGKRAVMNDYVRTHGKAKEQVKFFQRADAIEERKTWKRGVAQMKENRKIKLEERRRKLKQLIAREEQEWEIEMTTQGEGEQQRKMRIKQRIAELKQKRERERQDFVQQIEERRFVEGARELRAVDERIEAEKVSVQREMQMLEKQNKLEGKWREEQLLAQMVEMEIEKQERRVRVEREKRIREETEKNRILEQQMMDMKAKLQHEKEEQERKAKQMKQRWRVEEEIGKRENVKERQRKEARREQAEQFNRSQKQRRNHLETQEKNQDREMVEQLVAREDCLRRVEEEQKLRYKQETREFFKNIKNRSAELRVNEKKIEILLKEEMERQWKKKEIEWQKEASKREQLMRKVYQHRYKQIEDKKENIKRLGNQKRQERRQIQDKTHQWEREEQDAVVREMRKMRGFKHGILQQIEQKYLKEKKRLLDEADEARLSEIERQEYEHRLLLERNKRLKLLEEVRALRDGFYLEQQQSFGDN